MEKKYRVHEFTIRMSRDQKRFEDFLNSLEGEVIAVFPNVVPRWTLGGMGAGVNLVYVIEKTK
ncbi:TPA: hypothetical protein HA344_10595 [Candidatus Bathyarchaeota archaeon]|nr:hypothetical protein [Candidatus Bathyarchaeota archaeon]